MISFAVPGHLYVVSQRSPSPLSVRHLPHAPTSLLRTPAYSLAPRIYLAGCRHDALPWPDTARLLLSCMSSPVSVTPRTFSITLHNVVFTPSVCSTLNACSLGGYLPCGLAECELRELHVTLQLAHVVWRLSHFWSRRRRAAAAAAAASATTDAADDEEAEDNAAEVKVGVTQHAMEIRLVEMRMVHRAASRVDEWWGGEKALRKACADRVFSQIEACIRLISTHMHHGGHAPCGGEVSMSRRILRETKIVMSSLDVRYLDAALPGTFRMAFGEVQAAVYSDPLA